MSKGVLDLDVGNSCLKWRHRLADRDQRGVCRSGGDWTRALPAHLAPERIRVSSVAGSAAEAARNRILSMEAAASGADPANRPGEAGGNPAPDRRSLSLTV